MPTTRISFYGDVQGVGFRFFIRETALRCNLKGTVRNTNGYVEAVLEGDQGNIDKLLNICRKSYLGSKVRSIKTENAMTKSFTDFKIISNESPF